MNTPVEFPAVDEPLVSVLMVTFGAREWVAESLAALAAHTDPVYEVIVVDNGSRDGTREFLRDHVRNVSVHEAPRNLGFGIGNDLAALHARGEFLCFLNSDAIVPDGWLPPLLACLDDERVGAAVPMFVYPDGALQEAGAIVEHAGLVVALGAGGDADERQWKLRRFVAYGSAACLVMRRHDFLSIGGFDPGFGLGYYEDVELAFALRDHGLRVVLEPSVRVTHVQGASSPSHAEALALRDANRERFRARRQQQIWHRPAMFGVPKAHRFIAARDADAVDRVLVLAPRFPRRGDNLYRMVVTIAGALDEGIVTLAVPRRGDDPAIASELMARGVEAVAVDEWDAWLDRRRCHYAVVVPAIEPALVRATRHALADTQPQATMASLPNRAIANDAGAIESWLLSVGLIPVLDRRTAVS
jgi:GT2 family glycosyltransferase